MEEQTIARFTLRVPKELLDKLGYVASYNARTKNKELTKMIQMRILSFEKQHGPIHIEEQE